MSCLRYVEYLLLLIAFQVKSSTVFVYSWPQVRNVYHPKILVIVCFSSERFLHFIPGFTQRQSLPRNTWEKFLPVFQPNHKIKQNNKMICFIKTLNCKVASIGWNLESSCQSPRRWCHLSFLWKQVLWLHWMSTGTPAQNTHPRFHLEVDWVRWQGTQWEIL